MVVAAQGSDVPKGEASAEREQSVRTLWEKRTAMVKDPSMNPEKPLRIGTRGSPLALAQAHQTRDRLCEAHGWGDDQVEIT